MLKMRVLTAVVLLPVALLVLFVFPEDAFAFSVGLVNRCLGVDSVVWSSQPTCYTKFINNPGRRFDLVVFSTPDTCARTLVYRLYFLDRSFGIGRYLSEESKAARWEMY